MREKDSKPTFEDKLAVFKMNKKAFGDVGLLVDSLSAHSAPEKIEKTAQGKPKVFRKLSEGMKGKNPQTTRGNQSCV